MFFHLMSAILNFHVSLYGFHRNLVIFMWGSWNKEFNECTLSDFPAKFSAFVRAVTIQTNSSSKRLDYKDSSTKIHNDWKNLDNT